MTASPQRKLVAAAAAPTAIDAEDIVVGKDVLELVSSAMYIDPITIYREYVQNATDAVDAGRAEGLLDKKTPGQINIEIDAIARSVRIRDNGAGVAWRTFIKQLTALGASAKRGSSARGFRGVGRLAGLGYCQELIFRSRADGDKLVAELRWDCKKLRALLQNDTATSNVADLIAAVVTVSRSPDENAPAHFFEVELRSVVRTRNDKLMSPHAIADYLAQVAPVPFSPDFKFGTEIEAALKPHVALGNIALFISGIEGQVYRPHRNTLELGKDGVDEFERVEILEMPSVDGAPAALAWILHHSYRGAIPNAALVKGLRLRSGNTQVGDNTLLEELFPEPRFNGWSVGEIHVLDTRIVPNGRRDHFDQNAHYNNMVNHLAPAAREIAKHCRDSSIVRKLARDYELAAGDVKDQIAIIKQGTLTAPKRKAAETQVREALAVMTKTGDKLKRMDEKSLPLTPTVESLVKKLNSILSRPADQQTPLAHLPAKKREMYEHFFALIYEASGNRTVAKSLIDRILLKIG
jgi:molecular chaperone HtpG